MQVLVDTSVWIDYFKNGSSANNLDLLIDNNLIVINDIILAELIPFLRVKNQKKIIQLLNEIKKLPIEINWQEIIEFQVRCLKSGNNGIGIPDLIIAQNSNQNDCLIYSMDKHFTLLKKIIRIRLYED